MVGGTRGATTTAGTTTGGKEDGEARRLEMVEGIIEAGVRIMGEVCGINPFGMGGMLTVDG